MGVAITTLTPAFPSLVSRAADDTASLFRGVRDWPRTDREIEESVCRPLQALTSAEWVGGLLHPFSRQGWPLRLPDGLEPVLTHLSTRTDLPSRVESPRTRQVWSESHLLLWVPLHSELPNGKSNLGWIALAFPRSKIPTEQEWMSSQEILLEGLAFHLDHLFLESELRQQVKIREQFLSIASHELKTPLTSIYGILQLQERMMKSLHWPIEMRMDQERHLSFLRLVLRQTERMTELIDGLLDVSRIQAGRFAIEPMISEVGKTVQEVVSGRLGLLAREGGVQLLVDAPETLTAWVDPVRFEEVVSNLTMNALRMSPEGGVIWVRLRQEGNDVVLGVRDQGVVIPPEDRERVFEPFERAHAVARMGGLGLGLFISRQIAQLHGGDVVLLPSVGARGNVFEARFPVRKPLV
jgi:signal transduction histidine kinase